MIFKRKFLSQMVLNIIYKYIKFAKVKNDKIVIQLYLQSKGLWKSLAKMSARFFVFKWPSKFLDKNGIFNVFFFMVILFS